MPISNIYAENAHKDVLRVFVPFQVSSADENPLYLRPSKLETVRVLQASGVVCEKTAVAFVSDIAAADLEVFDIYAKEAHAFLLDGISESFAELHAALLLVCMQEYIINFSNAFRIGAFPRIDIENASAFFFALTGENILSCKSPHILKTVNKKKLSVLMPSLQQRVIDDVKSDCPCELVSAVRRISFAIELWRGNGLFELYNAEAGTSEWGETINCETVRAISANHGVHSAVAAMASGVSCDDIEEMLSHRQ